MATPSVIDLDALRAPISEAAPTGSDLNDQQILYDLRSLADAARSAEKKWAVLPYGPDGKQTVPAGTQAPPVPNWTPVLKAAVEILRTRSKDLTVCGFLLEALARLHGFAGIRDGSILVHDLAEKYWGSLFPPFSQDEFEALEQHPTVAPISGLNGASILPFAIDRIPLLKSTALGTVSGIDYLDVYGEHAKQLRITRDQFESAAHSVPAATFETLLEDATQALEQYRRMVALLTEKCSASNDASGPYSSNVEGSLEEAVRRIRHVSGRTESNSGSTEKSEESATSPTDQAAEGVRSAGAAGTGPPRTREDAYEMLRKVAEFFSRTEPHSPVSTALKRIVAWRTLSFPDLMKELVSNDDALKDLYRLTGFRDPET